MGNIMDYLEWRGDLTLEREPFCEVDNLLMSYLAYVRMEGIAPQPGEMPKSLKEISQEFFQIHSEEYLKKEKSLTRLAWKVMPKMVESERFADIRIRNFVNYISQENEVQFCAMEILLDDGTSFVAYRGTDDSIVGWKEDFAMVTGEVPAQATAVEYLNYVGQNCDCELRVGGHSKGGNLAVYAAAQCEPEIQKRIMTIYNNDGPGFRQEFLDSPGFSMIRSRIVRIIPESSIVGLLLLHDTEPEIIKSTQNGAMQHDGITWDVCGNHFVRAEEINAGSILFDKTLKKWMDEIEESKRGAFIEDLFSVLEAPGVETFTELQNEGLRTLKEILSKIEDLQPESKKIIQQLVKCILSSSTELLTAPLIARRDEWVQGWERETETEHFGQAEWK